MKTNRPTPEQVEYALESVENPIKIGPLAQGGPETWIDWEACAKFLAALCRRLMEQNKALLEKEISIAQERALEYITLRAENITLHSRAKKVEAQLSIALRLMHEDGAAHKCGHRFDGCAWARASGKFIKRHWDKMATTDQALSEIDDKGE